MLDLLESRIPQSWQKHMCLQQFRPLESSINEFVEFCKQLEFTKDTLIKKGADDSTNQEDWERSKRTCTTENRKQGRSNNNAEDKFHCMLHGPNPTHNTKNCRNLKKHVENIKKENACKNYSCKTQEELNKVFQYINKKIAEDRNHANHKRSACKKELNQFSDMSIKQSAEMNKEEEEF